MKLTKRDIQYIMNEAKNIVAEKRLNEGAVKNMTDSEAEVQMNNATGSTVGKYVTKGIEKVGKAAENLRNKFKGKEGENKNNGANLAQAKNGSSSSRPNSTKPNVLAKP